MQIAWHSKSGRPARDGRLVLCLLLLCCSGFVAARSVRAATATPDTLVYSVHDGDTLIRICQRFRSQTHHYSLDDLLTDIRQANGLSSNFLRIGQELKIPVVVDEPGQQVARRGQGLSLLHI